jgi:hypothetical protein
MLMACHKKPDTENVLPTFMDYTATAENGDKTGLTDPSDWTLTDTWNTAERNLFPAAANIQFETTSLLNVLKPAYPNPNSGQFQMVISQLEQVQLCIVNQDNLVLLRYTGKLPLNVVFNISDKLHFVSESKVRVYYILQTSQGQYYRGHGDIEIVR